MSHSTSFHNNRYISFKHFRVVLKLILTRVSVFSNQWASRFLIGGKCFSTDKKKINVYVNCVTNKLL